jgi:hypothetical protein
MQQQDGARRSSTYRRWRRRIDSSSLGGSSTWFVSAQPCAPVAWIGSAQRGRSREQQVLDQRSKDRPPTVRESSREQHGLGSCGQGETRRSRKSREEQNLGTGGGLEEGGGVQSREEQSSCAWEVGKGRGRSCSCVGSGEGKGRGALMG